MTLHWYCFISKRYPTECLEKRLLSSSGLALKKGSGMELPGLKISAFGDTLLCRAFEDLGQDCQNLVGLRCHQGSALPRRDFQENAYGSEHCWWMQMDMSGCGSFSPQWAQDQTLLAKCLSQHSNAQALQAYPKVLYYRVGVVAQLLFQQKLQSVPVKRS